MGLQILRICSLAGKLPQGIASGSILARPVERNSLREAAPIETPWPIRQCLRVQSTLW